MQYSKEFYKTREGLLRQQSESQSMCSREVYMQLLQEFKMHGPLQHRYITYEILYRLYVIENIDDRDMARLYGLSVSGMIAKRRRLGISDRQSDFEIVLRATELAIDKLGAKAFKL